MTSISMTGTQQDRARMPAEHAAPHIAVQILGLVLFAGFAIVATVMAFVHFWPAGFVLAIVLGWLGFGQMLRPQGPKPVADWVIAEAIKAGALTQRPDGTGNSSFDTYRAAVMERLEDEQTRFVGFLDRLRDAKDKSEFDDFMEDRARANREMTVGEDGLPPKMTKRGGYWLR